MTNSNCSIISSILNANTQVHSEKEGEFCKDTKIILQCLKSRSCWDLDDGKISHKVQSWTFPPDNSPNKCFLLLKQLTN